MSIYLEDKQQYVRFVLKGGLILTTENNTSYQELIALHQDLLNNDEAFTVSDPLEYRTDRTSAFTSVHPREIQAIVILLAENSSEE